MSQQLPGAACWVGPACKVRTLPHGRVARASSLQPSRLAGYWSNSSSNLPAARSEFATAPLTIATPGAESGMDSNRTVIYLLGGTDATGAPTSTVITYDAVLDQYNTSLAPMPSPRARLAAAAADGDTIVAVGGYNSTDAQVRALGAQEACCCGS